MVLLKRTKVGALKNMLDNNMDMPFETISKLGEAIYIHRKLIKNAEEAELAIDYLHSEEIFSDNQTSS